MSRPRRVFQCGRPVGLGAAVGGLCGNGGFRLARKSLDHKTQCRRPRAKTPEKSGQGNLGGSQVPRLAGGAVAGGIGDCVFLDAGLAGPEQHHPVRQIRVRAGSGRHRSDAGGPGRRHGPRQRFGGHHVAGTGGIGTGSAGSGGDHRQFRAPLHRGNPRPDAGASG
jgi:hypothetical protein